MTVINLSIHLDNGEYSRVLRLRLLLEVTVGIRVSLWLFQLRLKKQIDNKKRKETSDLLYTLHMNASPAAARIAGRYKSFSLTSPVTLTTDF